MNPPTTLVDLTELVPDEVMEIYLVRVATRPGGALYLEYKPCATTKDAYIAISHVWGTPESIQRVVIEGAPGECLIRMIWPPSIHLR